MKENPCCGCSCDVCANGHASGIHTDACWENFLSVDKFEKLQQQDRMDPGVTPIPGQAKLAEQSAGAVALTRPTTRDMIGQATRRKEVSSFPSLFTCPGVDATPGSVVTGYERWSK